MQLHFVTYVSPFCTSIAKVCMRNEFVGKKHTDNHNRVFRCLLMFYASDVSDIFVLNPWALPLEMTYLHTFVTCLNSVNVRGFDGLSGWHSTTTSGMPFSVAFLAVRLSTGSLVMEVALVAF